MQYNFADKKIQEAASFIEILVGTNPPPEITRKLDFLKKLRWGFKPEDIDKGDGTKVIVAESEALDGNGMSALKYNISWKKEEGGTEELNNVFIQFYDSYGSWFSWGKDFVNYGVES